MNTTPEAFVQIIEYRAGTISDNNRADGKIIAMGNQQHHYEVRADDETPERNRFDNRALVMFVKSHTL